MRICAALLPLACACCMQACRASIPNAWFACEPDAECPPGFSCDVAQSLCVLGDVPKHEEQSRAELPSSAAGSGAGVAPEASPGASAPLGGAGSGGKRAPSCQVGEARCAGMNLERCADDGFSWRTQKTCAWGCSALLNACYLCSPSMATCSGAKLSICRPDGSANETMMCPVACSADPPGCVECSATQHSCSGTCVDNTDPKTCGMSCSPCPAPVNATPTCFNGECGIVCDADRLTCNNRSDGCERTSWSFEETLEGWTVRSTNDASKAPLALTESRAHGGVHSAFADLNVTETNATTLISYQLCRGGTGGAGLDLQGKMGSVWIHVTTNRSDVGDHQCALILSNSTWSEVGPAVRVPNNQWTMVSSRWTTDMAATAQFLVMRCVFDNPAPWTGRVFLDDAALN